jgi:guanylate kinase
MKGKEQAVLVVISGPSGVGKDAVVEQMKRLDRSWYFVVTATTRTPRPGENDGEEYFFLDKPHFENMVLAEQFLEHAEVYGHRYGVPKLQVEEALQAGRDVVVKTDVKGARTLSSKVNDALLIFLAPPSMRELEKRLRGRKTNTGADLKRRLETAREEMLHQPEFDHVVVNHDGHVQETVAAIESFIAARNGLS